MAENRWKFWAWFQLNKPYSRVDSWFVWIAYVIIYSHLKTEWQLCKRKSHRNTDTHSPSLYIHISNRTHFSTHIVKWLWTIPVSASLVFAHMHARLRIRLLQTSFLSNTQSTDSACQTSWGPASGTFLMKRQSLQRICNWGHLCENILLFMMLWIIEARHEGNLLTSGKKKNILIVLFWHSSYCSLHLVLLRSFLCLMHHIFWTSIDDCLHAFELMWTLCAFLCQLHETYLLFTFHSIHLMLLYWMFLHCLWRHCIVQCLALINVTIKAGDGRW